MYCTKCGFENQNDAAFCVSCGAKAEPQQQNFRYQEPYGYNQPVEPAFLPVPADTKAKAIASLIMGIVSIIAGYIGLILGLMFAFGAGIFGETIGFSVLGLSLAVLAITFGKIVHLAISKKSHYFWMALAGIITGSIGLAMSAIGTICILGVMFNL